MSASIYDVARDSRVGLPAYGDSFGVTMRADETVQMRISPGFAHGYCALAGNTRVLYKLIVLYVAGSTSGVPWNDPALKIFWPVAEHKAIVDPRDGE